MATCCDIGTYNFNEAITEILLTDAVKAKFGQYPFVEVLYYDAATGKYLVSEGFLTQVKNDGTKITVDHGAIAFGQIILT